MRFAAEHLSLCVSIVYASCAIQFQFRKFESHQRRPSWGVDIGLDLFSKRCKITES